MISVTKITKYVYCPRGLFLTDVLKFEEPLKDIMVKGSVIHNIFDLMSREDESIIKGIENRKTEKEIVELFFSRYKEVLKKTILARKDELKRFNLNEQDVFDDYISVVEEEAKLKAVELIEFIEKYNVFGEELWNKLPKTETEVSVKSENLGIKGRIDRVKIGEEIIPYEIKSGLVPKDGIWEGNKIQLCAYALILEEKFRKTVRSGFVYYAGSSEKREVVFNAFMKQEVMELINKVNGMLNSSEIPRFPENTNKCRNCGLKDVCYDKKVLEKRAKEIKKAG